MRGLNKCRRNLGNVSCANFSLFFVVEFGRFLSMH